MKSGHAMLLGLGLVVFGKGCGGSHHDPMPETPGAANVEAATDPRIGVHKPGDDTRINSGAGPAEPLAK